MCKTKLIIQIDCDSELVLNHHYHLNLKPVFYDTLNIYLNKFQEYKIKSTIFVVGKDMLDRTKRRYIKRAIEDGHEIANHTFSHPPSLSSLSDESLEKEIVWTNMVLNHYFGILPLGFRAPNFDINSKVLTILNKEHFLYDCSILSTPYKPLLKLLKGQRPLQSGYLGKIHFPWPPKHPYIPQQNNLGKSDCIRALGRTLEIPIQTLPYFHLPCNFSYLMALPEKMGKRAMELLINWHRDKNEPLIFIFHLADLVDNQFLAGTEARFYKGIGSRMDLLDNFLELIKDRFQIIATSAYCKEIKEAGLHAENIPD